MCEVFTSILAKNQGKVPDFLYWFSVESVH